MYCHTTTANKTHTKPCKKKIRLTGKSGVFQSGSSSHSNSALLQEPTTLPAVIPGDVEEQLQMLGVFVGLDQQLWSRLCRLTRHSIRYNQHRLAQGGADAAAARTDLEAVSHHLTSRSP